MNKEELLLLNYIKELAKARMKQTAYDYYVSEAQLRVINNQVTIYLDKAVKQVFWEKEVEPLLIMAGFELYDQELTIHYEVTTYPTALDKANTSQTESSESPPSLLTPKPSYDKTGLNPNYTFHNFVMSEGNKITLGAALAVSELTKDAPKYNPLFIWGGSGLGKTHLLNAIGNKLLADNPEAKVRYITTDNFINEYTKHQRLGKMSDFTATFRNLDLLLVDDVQFLAKKTLSSTQDEFFHTFEALNNQNKQVVLTSDRNVEQLEDLVDRLVTRFTWGLTTDITPPDYETRVAILQQKIQTYNHLTFKPETIEYLANHFHSNVRELEGALKNIGLLASVQQIDTITINVAQAALKSRLQETPTQKVIPIAKIQEEVGHFYGISVADIKGPKRVQAIALARQVAMYLARELTDNSLPKIGKEFGNRDHSTVLHAYHKIQDALENDDRLALDIQTIQQTIR